jgi:hypothetical protein
VSADLSVPPSSCRHAARSVPPACMRDDAGAARPPSGRGHLRCFWRGGGRAGVQGVSRGMTIE